MIVAPGRLAAHLGAAALARVYTIHGDEPLQAQEIGDAIRAAARAAGCDEREVFNVSGAGFDWSAVIGAAQAPGLFAARRIIEIRIPGGNPGVAGSAALPRYCSALGDDVVTLVHLPQLDRRQMQSDWFAALESAGVTIRVDPVERRDLPAWLARRLAAQDQRVADGDEGHRTLAFFADRVEGNLLAAHQEIQKLGLVYPPGVLGFDLIEAVVGDVARFEILRLEESALWGQAARALRVLDGLRAEGESPVPIVWHLGEDIRALRRVRNLVDDGQPAPVALRAARVWGAKEKIVERALPRFPAAGLNRLVDAASRCDGISKGLPQPGWPAEPWDALRRLVLMLAEGDPQRSAAVVLHAG